MIKELYDVHCHLIPGVDDGSQSLEESLSALRAEFNEGVRRIICTPHVNGDDTRESCKARIERFHNLQDELEKSELKGQMELYLGSELYYSDSIAELLSKDSAYSLAGSQYILVEFIPSVDYKKLYQGLRNLITQGYLPILAHMERYGCLTKQEERIGEIEELGVYLQVNAATISSGILDTGNRFVRNLLKQGRIHLVGTDSHGMNFRPPQMKKAVHWIEKNCSAESAERILNANPAAVLQNQIMK